MAARAMHPFASSRPVAAPSFDLTPPNANGPALPDDWRRVLDYAWERLQDDDLRYMGRFVVALNTVRLGTSPTVWEAFVSEVRRHPICRAIHEEPFSRRAFEKPRGYAGDAPMLDLVYQDVRNDAITDGALTRQGRRLHEWIVEQPACRSVQRRRDILAALIDQEVERNGAKRILSIACGHLREAQKSFAVSTKRVEEFVALDQDAESLAIVDREQRQANVRAVKSSVRRLLTSPSMFGAFDLVYSAGLFDYLSDQVARALVRVMFELLRPGGQMLIANFAPDLRDIGYMEAVMDWKLIYRDEAAVTALAAGVPHDRIAERSIFRDLPGNVVYLMLRKS
jgi:SAM-dependent methyltransferase